MIIFLPPPFFPSFQSFHPLSSHLWLAKIFFILKESCTKFKNIKCTFQGKLGVLVKSSWIWILEPIFTPKMKIFRFCLSHSYFWTTGCLNKHGNEMANFIVFMITINAVFQFKHLISEESGLENFKIWSNIFVLQNWRRYWKICTNVNLLNKSKLSQYLISSFIFTTQER